MLSSIWSDTKALQRQQNKAFSTPYSKLKDVTLKNPVVTETIGQHNVITAEVKGTTSDNKSATIPDIADYQDVRSVIKRETKNGRVQKLVVKKSPEITGMTTLVFDEKDYKNKSGLIAKGLDTVLRIIKGIMCIIGAFELLFVIIISQRGTTQQKQYVKNEIQTTNVKNKKYSYRSEVDFDTFDE